MPVNDMNFRPFVRCILTQRLWRYGDHPTLTAMSPGEMCFHYPWISRHSAQESFRRMFASGEVSRVAHGFYRVTSAFPVHRPRSRRSKGSDEGLTGLDADAGLT